MQPLATRHQAPNIQSSSELVDVLLCEGLCLRICYSYCQPLGLRPGCYPACSSSASRLLFAGIARALSTYALRREAEAATLKTDMAVGAAPLAHKGFFNKETVAKINEGQGALDLANDLVAPADGSNAEVPLHLRRWSRRREVRGPWRLSMLGGRMPVL